MLWTPWNITISFFLLYSAVRATDNVYLPSLLIFLLSFAMQNSFRFPMPTYFFAFPSCFLGPFTLFSLHVFYCSWLWHVFNSTLRRPCKRLEHLNLQKIHWKWRALIWFQVRQMCQLSSPIQMQVFELVKTKIFIILSYKILGFISRKSFYYSTVENGPGQRARSRVNQVGSESC